MQPRPEETTPSAASSGAAASLRQPPWSARKPDTARPRVRIRNRDTGSSRISGQRAKQRCDAGLALVFLYREDQSHSATGFNAANRAFHPKRLVQHQPRRKPRAEPERIVQADKHAAGADVTHLPAQSLRPPLHFQFGVERVARRVPAFGPAACLGVRDHADRLTTPFRASTRVLERCYAATAGLSRTGKRTIHLRTNQPYAEGIRLRQRVRKCAIYCLP